MELGISGWEAGKSIGELRPEELASLYDKTPVKQIAEQFGVVIQTVYNKLKREGIRIRTDSENNSGENNPQWKGGTTWWTHRRPAALKRDEYKCLNCKTMKNLNVHHIIPRKLGGTDDLKNLRTLCAKCHTIEEPIRMNSPKQNVFHCQHCNQEFHCSRKGAVYCSNCQHINHKEWAEKNRGNLKEYMRRYRLEHRRVP